MTKRRYNPEYIPPAARAEAAAIRDKKRREAQEAAEEATDAAKRGWLNDAAIPDVEKFAAGYVKVVGNNVHMWVAARMAETYRKIGKQVIDA